MSWYHAQKVIILRFYCGEVAPNFFTITQLIIFNEEVNKQNCSKVVVSISTQKSNSSPIMATNLNIRVDEARPVETTINKGGPHQSQVHSYTEKRKRFLNRNLHQLVSFFDSTICTISLVTEPGPQQNSIIMIKLGQNLA